MKKLLNRFKSWAVWLSLAAMVTFCVKTFCHIDISDTMNGFLDVLLPLLISFGIVNNPDNRGEF